MVEEATATKGDTVEEDTVEEEEDTATVEEEEDTTVEDTAAVCELTLITFPIV